MTRSGRWAGALLGTALLLGSAACSGGGGRPDASSPPTASAPARLVQRAALQPCPHTAAGSSPVTGGLPSLTLPCIGGGAAVDLAGLRGPALVNIYETDCVPCQRESGYLSQAAAADRGSVDFLGVEADGTPTDALTFAAAEAPPAHYPLLWDEDDQLVYGFNHGFPTTLFVDAAGKVVDVQRGPFSSTADLQSAVARYLGGS